MFVAVGLKKPGSLSSALVPEIGNGTTVFSNDRALDSVGLEKPNSSSAGSSSGVPGSPVLTLPALVTEFGNETTVLSNGTPDRNTTNDAYVRKYSN